MSSIAATSLSQSFSPLSRLQNELQSEVSSGAISTDDQSALNSALSDIDSALQAQAPTDGSRSSPRDVKSKIDNLIAQEVSDGKLTSAQADELKNVFAQAFKGGPGGPGAPGGSGGPGGAGGGGTSETSTDPADTNGDGVVSAAEQAAYDAKHPDKVDADSSGANSSSSSDSNVTKLLSDFLNLLKDSQGSSSNYNANGDSLISQIQSLIVNYQA